MGIKENKNREVVEQARSGRNTTNLYPTNTREVDPWSRDLKGVVWWRGGGEPIFNFQPRNLLGKCHSMHAREVGKEKPQGLIHSNQEERLIPRLKKK